MGEKYKGISILFLLIFILFPGLVEAEGSIISEQKNIDISTSPSTTLFYLTNVEPGDKMSRVVTIYNKGKDDFSYLYSTEFLKGSENFYNELLIEVSNEDKVLVKGKLKDLNELDARELKSNSSEILHFLVEIPYELGNEFQGLSTEFQFNFSVEGPLGIASPGNGDGVLPYTGTIYYKLIVAGIILIVAGISLYIFTKRKNVQFAPPIKLSKISLKQRKEV
ncbi:LPXTG cell wall anchor domain-containing protein [Rossellomorea aquimaris]|uniref:LPXTG cell wall anchor domain-containing protein n=1 Tax=Rossellomorea aquimaris TaxID=189382 RepID=UPI001CD1C972|nr:LPXTG cell wall anchor domain-containing protein [Rossellomorea aquimaris]MCA1055139.1 LPXTG cell wall anchor domain-containing protein [Rossellomorea aquimaris]